MKHSLQTDKAKALVDAIKDAKRKLTVTDDQAHEIALDQLREAEEAYADYIYSQRP